MIRRVYTHVGLKLVHSVPPGEASKTEHYLEIREDWGCVDVLHDVSERVISNSYEHLAEPTSDIVNALG